MTKAVIKGASYVISHIPSLVRYGSKPEREINKDATVLQDILSGLRSYEEALAYPPNQVFIGNMRPDDLKGLEKPWTKTQLEDANRFSQSGEIMPEEEFYGWLKIADVFQLVSLEQSFLSSVKEKLTNHLLIKEADLTQLGDGVPLSEIEDKIKEDAIPLYVKHDQLIGCVQTAHEEDKNLSAQIMLENLSNKATGIVAMRHALHAFDVRPEQIDYVFGCDEEAVGDRYQRGGGNIAKSIAEHADCINATGSDIKAFCCAPGHAVNIAAALVESGLYEEIVVVGGGSLAKLGMKYAGNLSKDMPITEDEIASIAILVGKDDGKSPIVRLDASGKHEVSAGSSAQAIYKALVEKPLAKIGMNIGDVDKYAVELHNPDVTVPNGNGDVPAINYRAIAAMAVIRKEIPKEEMNNFQAEKGMPGFSPTQGHIASAIPFVGHARQMIMSNEINNAMFIGKGSLFLGKMTKLSDGASFLIEKNTGSDMHDGNK